MSGAQINFDKSKTIEACCDQHELESKASLKKAKQIERKIARVNLWIKIGKLFKPDFYRRLKPHPIDRTKEEMRFKISQNMGAAYGRYFHY